jgi:hypothetical protein
MLFNDFGTILQKDFVSASKMERALNQPKQFVDLKLRALNALGRALAPVTKLGLTPRETGKREEIALVLL